MSLAFNEAPGLRTMIVRVGKEQLDSLPIDNVLGNMDSLLVALTRLDEVQSASEYEPTSENYAITGAMLPDGSAAYRIEVQWNYGLEFETVAKQVTELWKTFSKAANHVVIDPEQAVYDPDGNLNHYIGCGG